ncbi:S-layer homology domain-containing protein [Paenibacillus lignilyticus]|uniref:S-layer homology domain-containing protein n=1 Tax=Paenibacillus lignilyticus TaxID=1172615 RepID=A0ABS5CG42_9BACL|nr:S-layer homology domain-containing protein [Paenibacillus lignilyticus]MBP3964832.1 S-layer homology domain-containing protein [Paenibacillus lignilyticus]
MTVRKKLVVTTIAASLVAGSLAGVPLSNKGLAQQLGLSNIAAAATPTEDQFMDRLDAIHDALIAGKDAQSVRDLRTQIGALTFAADNDAIDPLWAYVPAPVKNDTNKELLFDTFQALGSIMYSTRNEEITAIRSDADLQAALVQLATITGTTKLTVNDLLAFVDAVETAAVESVQTNLGDLLDDESGSLAVALIKAGVNKVLDNNTLEVSKVLNWFKDETDATKEEFADGLAATLENVTTELPAGEAATKALVVAFVRAETVNSFTTTDSGRTHTYTLTLKGITIPNALLTWSASGDVNVEVVAGKVTLASTATTGTAVIQAKLQGKVIFEKSDTLTYSTSPIVLPPTPPTITQVLDELKGKIAAATGAEKDKLIQEAIDKAAAAVAELAKIDAKGDVKVVDGKATVTVSSSAIDSAINEIAKVIAALKAAAPGSEAALKVVLTIDLGTVNSKDVSVGVNSDIVKKASAAGVFGFNFGFNGFSATLPVGAEINDAFTFNVKNNAPAGPAASLKAASDAYDFALAVGGKEVHEFSNPIEVNIPVNTTGVDKDLLTVFDGTTYYGGVYHDGVITEKRDHFSTYVVVENKVTFKDTNKVKAWAGRQIEVMAAKGAIQGRANGAFVPNGEVTRAEFAKMLVRALDLDNVLAKEGFSDVNAADWFAPFVAAASEAGIIKGRTATSFEPNATITRAEMAVMVARGLEAAKGVKPSAEDLKALDAFKDAGTINASLKDGVAFAANNGLVVGDKGKFNPNATATRAQAAVIIYRAFNFKG